MTSSVAAAALRGGGTRLQKVISRSCASSPLPEESPPLIRREVVMPGFVHEKVNQIQIDIASQFINDQYSQTAASSLPTTSKDFQENLSRMAKYYFQQGGKLFRPTVALLMANACNQTHTGEARSRLEVSSSEEVSLNQYKIAMIAEMIHVASLVHDDVIDEADTRRGSATVNAVWGNKMAVLVGDFILARATQILCSIGRPNVISVMASIIEDLVMGEFMQMTANGKAFNSPTDRLNDYMAKTYKKTASLFANSCRSAAILAEASSSLQEQAESYGRHLGLAFQLVDDIMDFEESAAELGKPAAADLKLGLATGPVLFAAREHPILLQMMERKFGESGDADSARRMVLASRGIELTRQLANKHCQAAARIASDLPNGDGVGDMLVEFALKQLDRRV